jgi:hypothetical protein
MRNRPNHLPRRLVLPLAPVRHLPQQVVFGPGQISHFHDHLWPHPVHARQLERRAEPAVTWRRLRQRHLRDLQRRQHAGQPLQLLVRHAGAGTAGIEQAVVFGVVAQQQGADVRSAALRIGPADNNELLAVEALGLDPDPAVPWSLGTIDLLGDGALQAQLAGLCAEGRTLTDNVFAVAQAAHLLLEQPLQSFLALDQRQLGRAHAI